MNNMNLETPVVFIIFKRPEPTQIVFEAIRKAKPKQLFIIADGPRDAAEAEKCEETRAIACNVDWDCEVQTHFSETNLGCGLRISSGLDWVFSQVEEAIILEEDCLPTPSFFPFCQTLLERYRHDPRIMLISGNNFNFKKMPHSYFFSRYVLIWGRATWRRAWKHYDFGIKTWPQVKNTDVFKGLFKYRNERAFWTGIFDSLFSKNIDTWDYQWQYACFLQNGLSVIPNVNLVSNIGFGADATNTTCKAEESPRANIPTHDIQEIVHPPLIAVDAKADRSIFKKVHCKRSFPRRVYHFLKRHLKAVCNFAGIH